MEAVERLQQNRRLIEDFTARTLTALVSDYARLLYVALLRDLVTGRYQHEGLEALYPRDAVQQALTHVHEELFLRLLEMPLEQQEWDLRSCLGNMEGHFGDIVARWRELEFCRVLVPTGMPLYLQDLFCSNVQTLLGLFAEERASRMPVA